MHPNADICVYEAGPAACEDDPRGCFPCRLRLWNVKGTPGFKFYGGRDGWRDGQTTREKREEMYANAAKYGNEPPEPVGGYASGGPIV